MRRCAAPSTTLRPSGHQCHPQYYPSIGYLGKLLKRTRQQRNIEKPAAVRLLIILNILPGTMPSPVALFIFPTELPVRTEVSILVQSGHYFHNRPRSRGIERRSRRNCQRGVSGDGDSTDSTWPCRAETRLYLRPFPIDAADKCRPFYVKPTGPVLGD